MKALLKNYRQSPRKVRLVADFVRGKKVDAALVALEFLPKRASRAIAKLIASARANAEHNFKVVDANLFIKEIRVDEGPTMKRHRPVSRGRAHGINKRTSHIQIALGIAAEKKTRTPKAVATPEVSAPKKTVKKVAEKKTAAPKAKKSVNKKTA